VTGFLTSAIRRRSGSPVCRRVRSGWRHWHRRRWDRELAHVTEQPGAMYRHVVHLLLGGGAGRRGTERELMVVVMGVLKAGTMLLRRRRHL